MNIVIVHDTGVDSYSKWSDVKRHTSFSKDDFTKIGTDYILETNGESYEISKDLKLLEHVAAKKMFAKNKMDLHDIISIVTLLMVFVLVAS